MVRSSSLSTVDVIVDGDSERSRGAAQGPLLACDIETLLQVPDPHGSRLAHLQGQAGDLITYQHQHPNFRDRYCSLVVNNLIVQPRQPRSTNH